MTISHWLRAILQGAGTGALRAKDSALCVNELANNAMERGSLSFANHLRPENRSFDWPSG